MASYDSGYEDERFQHPVGQSFHCGICYNVVKDPTMCRHNEHLFCRACITRSLVNSQTCPSCVEPLTVATLTQPSRTVMNLLSELKIRCEFFNRGCEKFIELGNLERHVTDCGFAPAICSNEGCRVEVNKQDLLHHETAVCELRRVQCHSCSEIRQEMNIVKVNLAAMNVKLLEVGEKLDGSEKTVEINAKAIELNVKTVEQNVIAKVNLVHDQLNEFKIENRDTKKCLNKITQQLESLTQQASRRLSPAAEREKKEIAEADIVDREQKVVVAGGWNGESLNSVEMFSLSNGVWKPLQRKKEARSVPSSFVHNKKIYVSGGHKKGRGFKSIESISINVIDVNESLIWEIVPAELSAPVWGHCCVTYNERVLQIGGRNDSGRFSDKITDISLVPPYTSILLATMPVTVWLHCVLLFGDEIVIFGGKTDCLSSTILKSVLMYDISKNKLKELASLPYPVCAMAAVKWGDDNVIIMGGADIHEKPLNKVLIYNIKTQKSHMLPDMKYKRKGCMAAVVRDTVIVMGGDDRRSLNSVESFRFDRFTWEELPPMQEARSYATAVVC